MMTGVKGVTWVKRLTGVTRDVRLTIASKEGERGGKEDGVGGGQGKDVAQVIQVIQVFQVAQVVQVVRVVRIIRLDYMHFRKYVVFMVCLSSRTDGIVKIKLEFWTPEFAI